MTREGFIFNSDLCVACKACSAACMLENKWQYRARNIYSHNPDGFSPDAVINLSMACNHCIEPLCLNGCPTSAYLKDNNTGAILIDPARCIGCRYCIWNCPYDAPKFNDEKGVIEKCNLCFQRIGEGLEPACSSSCPTGALSFGEINQTTDNSGFLWFPEKRINPGMQLTGKEKSEPLRIIPEHTSQVGVDISSNSSKKVGSDWSLIAFTFILTVSVSVSLAGIESGTGILKYTQLAAVIGAGIMSLLHLKSWLKAWRSLSNILFSPLSREILFFIIYSLLVITGIFYRSIPLEISIAVTGLILLLSIDNVYTSPSENTSTIFHSGQTFLTGLLMTSFFLEALIPFLFIASIKLTFNLVLLLKRSRGKNIAVIRFIRFALLFITVMALINDSMILTTATCMVFGTGELIDRILYYIDFEPLNVKNTINRPLN